MNGFSDSAAAAAALGLQLPTHLQSSTGGTAKREHIVRKDAGAGKTVTLDRVDMGRAGWKYEVNAEYPTRDADGPVIKRDTLWLPDHDQARQLFRAAGARLLAAPSEFAAGGLTQLARQLQLRFDVQ